MEEPLTMNDDALDAALALLASLDDEDSLNTLLVSTDISDTSTDGSTSEKKPQRSAKSKKSSTTRQREEIERLQGEITELKQLRVRLKSRHARFKVVGLWAAIARRQRRFRERAEETNAALRVRIEEQFHTGRDVFSLLMAGMDEQVPRLRFSDDLTSPESMAHLEHLYNCRHAAFSDPCFADTSASFRVVQIVGSNESQTTTVGRDSWTSPFTARKLDQAFWDMMCQRSSWEGIESVLEHKCTSDTVTVSYRSVVATDTTTLGAFQCRMVIRRFGSDPEALGDYVMCYFAESVPSDSASEALRDLVACEVLWYRVRESQSDPSADAPACSQFQTSRRGCVDCTTMAAVYRQHTMKMATTYALQEIESDLERTQEALEHGLVIANP